MPKLLFVSALSSFLLAFGQPHDKSEAEAAMQHYNRLLEKTDADSIASLYTADGGLGAVAHSDSIRRFLRSFKNVQVFRVTSRTDWIKPREDTARQSGRYMQVAVIDRKDTARRRELSQRIGCGKPEAGK